MKKNIVIIVLSVLLIISLAVMFMGYQNKYVCPKCEVCKNKECMCVEKNCPKLEVDDTLRKLDKDSFIQKVYEDDNLISESKLITSEWNLELQIKNNKNKAEILADYQTYDLENGTYIIFKSEGMGCGDPNHGIKEVLIKGNFAFLLKDIKIKGLAEPQGGPADKCTKLQSNVYSIYIPVKIIGYKIIDVFEG